MQWSFHNYFFLISNLLSLPLMLAASNENIHKEILISTSQTQTELAITILSDNRSDFFNSVIPKYEKFEIDFEINNSIAKNPYLPYTEIPPPGVEPGVGITVNALFTHDNWKTTYSQPGFYYQEFDHQVKNDRDWLYPTGNYFWRVRFAPDKVGTWQYKLVAQDAGGEVETSAISFTVVASNDLAS